MRHKLWPALLGWIALPGTVWLIGRLVWDGTVRTYQRGAQPLGSFLHDSPRLLLVFYFGSLLLAHVYVVAAVVALIAERMRSIPLRTSRLVPPLAAGLLLAMLYIPYAWWMLLTIKTVGAGPHGGDFLITGVWENRVYLVDAALRSGTPVDALYSSPVAGAEHITGLEIACRLDNRPMAQHLLSRGANPDLAPTCVLIPEIKARMTKKPAPAIPDLAGTAISH